MGTQHVCTVLFAEPVGRIQSVHIWALQWERHNAVHAKLNTSKASVVESRKRTMPRNPVTYLQPIRGHHHEPDGDVVSLKLAESRRAVNLQTAECLKKQIPEAVVV